MRTSLREDYLEAILIHTGRYSYPPSAQDLGKALHIDESDVRTHMDELAYQGDVSLHDDGSITLTDRGTTTGKQIIKKHETLQCFLSEILGMDRSSASDEACKIEHAVSDETIDRLGDYLRLPVLQPHSGDRVNRAQSGIRGVQKHDSCGFARSLVDFEEGERLVVRDILGRGCSKRLLDLGVVPGQLVVIKRKLGNRSIVVQVKDCDVALSPENASAICVERVP
ncbi:MAG: metal-dependent transcriptional regulator [Methanoregula sp.]|jgi:DtxR family Mn-dependent transcriptional regulator